MYCSIISIWNNSITTDRALSFCSKCVLVNNNGAVPFYRWMDKYEAKSFRMTIVLKEWAKLLHQFRHHCMVINDSCMLVKISPNFNYCIYIGFNSMSRVFISMFSSLFCLDSVVRRTVVVRFVPYIYILAPNEWIEESIINEARTFEIVRVLCMVARPRGATTSSNIIYKIW